MLMLVGNELMIEIGYLMPTGRSVPESLLWNLADKRPFSFQQWSKSGDGCCWMVAVRMCHPWTGIRNLCQLATH